MNSGGDLCAIEDSFIITTELWVRFSQILGKAYIFFK